MKNVRNICKHLYDIDFVFVLQQRWSTIHNISESSEIEFTKARDYEITK